MKETASKLTTSQKKTFFLFVYLNFVALHLQSNKIPLWPHYCAPVIMVHLS
jgi:hypothetical protein